MNEFLKLLELLPYRIQQPDLQEQGLSEFLELLLPSWGQATDDQILLIFVCVIGLVFLLSVFYFGWKTIRRQRLIKRLAEEVNKYNRSDNRPTQPSIKQKLKEKFDDKGELTEAWREFEDSLIIQSYNENQIVYKTDEASFFFSEGRLLDQHLNLRFWNSVPALLVGLGILGTFVGLVWGLIPFSDVDFANTDQIREAIKELLSGVSTAFVSSVWGMLASILFNGLEKWGIGRVSRAIADLQRSLDQVFTLTRAEEIAMRQQDELEQQTAALKSVSTDFANAVTSAMEPGRLELIQELQELRVIFNNVLTTDLVPRLDNLNAAVTESRKRGTQERKEIIQELQGFPTALTDEIKPSLEKLNEAVEKLRQEKEESSTDAVQKLVEEFQKFLSGSIMEQMGTLAETLGKVSESLITLPKQMEQMIEGVQEQINQICKLLDEKSKEMFKEMNEEMRKMVTEVHKLVESIAGNMETVSDQTIRTLREAIAQLQKALDSTASQTSAEFEEMTKRMRELVDHSAIRLDNIFKGGEQSISTLLQQQDKQTETINAQLDNWQQTLTKGRETLERMDTSVTSVRQLIETTETLSGQLMKGATQIESAGQSLTRSSEAFNQENEKYITANRETTNQIQNVLGESQRLLNDSVQRFQTIDNGLQSIFEQIEKGLGEYATTTRDSINTYLRDFSAQLTQASIALAGSVEALDESIGILVDMIERLPRR